MRVTRFGLFAGAAALLAVASAAAFAAQGRQQQVTPPETRYWVGATTSAGLGAMGAGGGGMMDAMRMAAGAGRGDSAQMLEVAIGSSLTVDGRIQATHDLPPAASLEPPLLLTAPQRGGRDAEPPGALERPKGRILFFWGCRERAGAGQPAVLDFESIVRGEAPDIGGGPQAQEIRKPSSANSRSFADWPNSEDSRRNRRRGAVVPAGGSLVGDHLVTSTFGPEIRFTVPADKTYMAPVRYSSTQKLPSGAVALRWDAVPRASGYFIGVTAAGKNQDELVLWSSAERSGYFLTYADIAPGEVARLAQERVVLQPRTTACTIPAEAMAAMGEGGMLAFTAFGDQATFIHPARPSDPAITWDQEWFVRVGFKSVRGDMINADGVTDMAAMMAGGGAAGAAGGEAPPNCPPRSAGSAMGEAIGAATGIPGAGALGRALGGRRNQQAQPPADPRCPQ